MGSARAACCCYGNLITRPWLLFARVSRALTNFSETLFGNAYWRIYLRKTKKNYENHYLAHLIPLVCSKRNWTRVTGEDQGAAVRSRRWEGGEGVSQDWTNERTNEVATAQESEGERERDLRTWTELCGENSAQGHMRAARALTWDLGSHYSGPAVDVQHLLLLVFVQAFIRGRTFESWEQSWVFTDWVKPKERFIESDPFNMELPVLVLVAVILSFGTSIKLNVPRLRLSYKGKLRTSHLFECVYIF